MERIVYYGSLNNSKSEELFQKIKKDLEDMNGNKFYYLMPNGELLTRRRNSLIDQLDFSLEINLYTFDNIVSNLVADLNIFELDEALKEIFIKRAISNLIENNLIIYYKESLNMDGYIKVLSSIIGDFKRNLISPTTYLSSIKNVPFYKEIGLIYSEYEKLLRENSLVDREGMYLRAIELLESGKKIELENSLEYIVLDGFYDFRPIEMKIIEELLKFDIDIYINIPFKLNKELGIVKNTIDSLRNLGFSIEEICEEANSFINIAGNLFNEVEEKLSGDIDIVKAANLDLEVKELFKDIKKLLNKGVSGKRIGVIALDEKYIDKIIESNKQEKLAINYEYNKSIIDYKLSEELLGFIKAYIDDLDKDSILNIIKYGYINPISHNIEELEYILRQIEWNSLEELEKLIKEEIELTVGDEHRDILISLIYEINNLYGNLKAQDSLKNYNEFIIDLIDDLSLEEAIIDEYKNTGDYFIFKRDLDILFNIKLSLAELEEFEYLIESIKIEEYYDLLYTKLKNIQVSVHLRNLDGINLLELINSRNIEVDYLFILGMSNDVFPRLDRGNFFINDDNMKEISKTGLKSMTYREKIENEGIKLSSAIGSVLKKLHIYYNTGIDGENIGSIFLEDILNIVSPNSINFREIETGDFIPRREKDITNKRDILQREIYFKGNRLLDFKEEIDYIEKTCIRENNEIKPSKDLLKDVNNYTKDRIYSTSVLEAYGKCPFYFLLKNILLVEDINIEDGGYSRLNLGNLYHEVLRIYFIKNTSNIKQAQISDSIYKVKIEEIKDILFRKSSEYGFNKELINHSLILDNAADNLYDFIVSDMERIFNSKNKFIPVEFEKEFGKKGDCVLGNNIKIRGMIDRIDKSLLSDSYAIIDYKTSFYGVNDINSIKEGYSLQIPIYIIGEENKKVNLAGYGIIKSADFKVAMGILEENPQLNKRNKGAISREEYDELLNDVVDNIEDIVTSIKDCRFPVEPKLCWDYCTYRFICRYSKDKEVK